VLSSSDDVVTAPSPLHARIIGAGPPVLFVHGLGASGRYWGSGFDALADSHRLAFVDLSGFGRSRSVPGPYGIDGQVRHLRRFVDEKLPAPPLVLVGHSFGAVVAFAAAARWTGVSAVVAFGLPAFTSPEEGRRHLVALGLMNRWMATTSPWARRACWTLCRFRPVARAVAPFMAPDLPPEVARDGVEHTWASARQAFDSLVHDADLVHWAGAASASLVVVQGDGDLIAPPESLARVLGDTRMKIRTMSGDHHLPLRQPDRCLEILQELIGPS